MKSTAIIAGAAFALGLLSALAWTWLQSSPSTQVDSAQRHADLPPASPPRSRLPAASAVVPASSTAIAARSPGRASSSPQLPLAPLPPIDAPLASVLPELERRAHSGDAPAACRIAAELSRCGTLDARRQYRGMIDPVETSASQVSEMAITRAAQYDVALETDERICAGIAPEQTHDALPWLYEAARLGNPAAMSAFARPAWWHDGSVLRHPQLIERYRAEAGAMAEAAIAAGDQSMAAILGLALAGASNVPGGSTILTSVVERNPVRARALLLIGVDSPIGKSILFGDGGPATINLFQRRLDLLTASLDPAQLAESDAQAALLRATMPASTQPRYQENPFGGGSLVKAESCAR